MKPHILNIQEIDHDDEGRYHGDGLAVTVKCIMTGKESIVMCGRQDFHRWTTGVTAQEAFPYLTADQRELLITGTSSEGWDKFIK